MYAWSAFNATLHSQDKHFNWSCLTTRKEFATNFSCTPYIKISFKKKRKKNTYSKYWDITKIIFVPKPFTSRKNIFSIGSGKNSLLVLEPMLIKAT